MTSITLGSFFLAVGDFVSNSVFDSFIDSEIEESVTDADIEREEENETR